MPVYATADRRYPLPGPALLHAGCSAMGPLGLSAPEALCPCGIYRIDSVGYRERDRLLPIRGTSPPFNLSSG